MKYGYTNTGVSAGCVLKQVYREAVSLVLGVQTAEFIKTVGQNVCFENIFMCNKTTDQDRSVYVLHTYSSVLCTACMSFRYSRKIFKF